MVMLAETLESSSSGPASRPRLRRDTDGDASHLDQRVILRGTTWSQFETLLAIRGDGAGARLYFLEGEIELMSPSRNHEGIKTTIGRLVEAYADEMGLDLNGYGSWTLKNVLRERGAEPDECYVLGAGVEHRDTPDLAIEVMWTSGGLDKLSLYAGLGVRELWVWRHPGAIDVHVLHGEHYERVPQSQLLPALDIEQLAGFLGYASQSQAVRAYRAALLAKKTG